MRSLVQKLAAARLLWIGPPLAVVAGPPAVAIARPDAQQRADLARRANLVQLLDGGVIAVVVADLEHAPAPLGCRDGLSGFLGVAPQRLFAQDVFAGQEGGGADGGQCVVRRRNYRDIEIGRD